MLSNCTYDNLRDCRITFEILHAFIGRDTFNRKPSVISRTPVQVVVKDETKVECLAMSGK